MSDDNNVSVKKQDIHDDNQHAPKLVPELRFPGFNDEWKKVKIKNIFNERKEKGFKNLELLSVTINDGVIKTDTLNSRNTSNPDKSKYKRVLPNDIAYNSMRMWQGACGVSSYEGIVSPAYTVLSPKNNINSQFFYYYFKTHFMLYQFTKYSQGLTSDTWNLKYPLISKIKINLPTYEEQTRIVNFINIIDKKIELLEKKLCLYQKYEKQIRKDIFDFKTNNIKYNRYQLGNIAEIKKGFTPSTKKEEYWNNGKYYWLSIGDMNKKYIKNSKKRISENAIKNKNIVKKDTLIMSFKLTIGKVAILKEDMYTNEAIANFTWKIDNISTEFMYFYLKTLNIEKYGSQAAKGITLNTETLNAIPIMLPEYNIQLNIVNKLLKFNKKIDLICEKLNNIKNFKKFLLQKMFI